MRSVCVDLERLESIGMPVRFKAKEPSQQHLMVGLLTLSGMTIPSKKEAMPICPANSAL